VNSSSIAYPNTVEQRPSGSPMPAKRFAHACGSLVILGTRRGTDPHLFHIGSSTICSWHYKKYKILRIDRFLSAILTPQFFGTIVEIPGAIKDFSSLNLQN
jgi:hypothetical protein